MLRIAEIATNAVLFALAQKLAALHIGRAFQASSPKPFTGWSSDQPFFLPESPPKRSRL
jgi:hypothetical protein